MSIRPQLAALLLVAAPVLAGLQVADLALEGGQKATGDIAFDGEEDRIAVELVAGSRLTFTAKGDKKAPLVPEVDVADGGGVIQLVGPEFRKNAKTTAGIKNWTVPATGTWYLAIRGTGAGPRGAYSLKTKVTPPPAPPVATSLLAGAGAEIETSADALAGSLLDVVLKAKKGESVVPRVVRILDPQGGEVSLATAGIVRKDKPNGQVLKKVPLPLFGTYRIVVAGDADSVGEFTTKLKITPPKASKVVEDFSGASGGEAAAGRLLSVEILPDPVEVGVGETVRLAARAVWEDGLVRDATRAAGWATANLSAATVDSSVNCGELRGVAAGGTTVQAWIGPVESRPALVLVGGATVDMVSVLPADAEPDPRVAKGETIGLAARATFAGADPAANAADVTRTAIWTVDGGGVLSASGSRLTGNAVGQGTATATLGTASDDRNVIVTAARIVALRVSPPYAELSPAGSRAVTARATYGDGSTADVTGQATFRSDHVGAATVGGSTVQYAGRGSAGIRATLDGITSPAAVFNCGPLAITSVAVDDGGGGVPLGGTRALRALIAFEDGGVRDAADAGTWASGNAAVVSVGNDDGNRGVATAQAIGGPASITVTVNGITSPALGVFGVDPEATDLFLVPRMLRVDVGQTQRIGIYERLTDGTARDASGAASWSTSNAMAVTAQSGEVTGIADGGATITAMSGGRTARSLVLSRDGRLTGIEIGAPPDPPLGRGAQFVARAILDPIPGPGSPVSEVTDLAQWVSDDPVGLPVGPTGGEAGGVVRPARETSGNVRAYFGGFAAPAEASNGVAPVDESFAIFPAAPRSAVGEGLQLAAQMTSSDGTVRDAAGPSSWTAGSPSVADVNATGRVDAKAPGISMIQATSVGSLFTDSVTYLVLGDAPQITDVTPDTVFQGATGVTLTITGSNLGGGTPTVSFSGSGITVDSGPTVNPAGTQATVTVSVSGAAAFGGRNLVYTTLNGQTTAVAAVSVVGSAPTLVSVSPSNITIPGAGNNPQTVTLTGTGFVAGDTFSVQTHTGVSVSGVSVSNATTMTGTVTVAAGTQIARLDVTVTQAAQNGGASVTLRSALKIGPADPVVTALEPGFFLLGTQNGKGRIVGSNFQSGMTHSIETATGVTVTNLSRSSSTLITFDISVTPDATPTTLDVTLTNPGDIALVLQDALAIAPRDPNPLSFSAPALGRGVTNLDVVVTGTNFGSGAQLEASGSGVTFGNVTVTSSERIDARATVDSGAALGSRDLTVRHAASEGGRGGTLTAAFDVTTGSPGVTAISPSALGRTGSGGPTRTFPVVLTGSGFVEGATVALTRTGGSGLTVASGSVDVRSGTEIACDVSISGTTTTGTWNVVVTNPAALGDSGTSGNGLLDVRSETTLTVNAVVEPTGDPYGGETVTVYGSGFQERCQVEFGTVKALRSNRIDQNTLVCVVPVPANGTSISTTAATAVNVKVTNDPTGSPTAATLTNGYAYGRDLRTFKVTEMFPVQAGTTTPQNLRAAVLKLSAPANTGTLVAGTTTGTHGFWFEAGGFQVSQQLLGFGADPRYAVFARTSGGNLSTAAGGRYVVDIPTAVKSLSGAPLVPERLTATGNHDQWSFTVTTATTDTTAPSVTGSTPVGSATGVSPTTAVEVTFDEELNPLTVTTNSITLSAGGNAVPVAITLYPDLRTVALVPHRELATSTQHTITVTSTVADLFGNTMTQTTRTFTTSDGTDGTVPVVTRVRFEEIRSDMDGSTTYVSGPDSVNGTPQNPGASQAFDLFLPRSGWQVTVEFSDEGGSGIDETSFSAKASVAVGGTSSNTELAGKFDVSSTRAVWRVASTEQFTAGDDVTLTFLIKDAANNTSSSHVVTFDVIDITANSLSGNGGDLDPFGSRQTWLLRDDVDVYTASFSTNGTDQEVTTTGSSNGIRDLDEALRISGLNSPNMSAGSAVTANGPSLGTNDIVRRLFMERLRAYTRARYGIDEDGGRPSGAPDIEFILNGEQGSLSGLPTWSTASTSNSAKAYSEMDIGGDTGPNSNLTAPFGTVGTAFTDRRNRRQEANLNSGASAGNNEGVFVINMMKFSMNSSTSLSTWGARVLANFQTAKGGTPIGEHADDPTVLAGTFDRTAQGNTQAQNDRYDAIMDAIEASAASVSGVNAHEIGHSLGLVPDGAPKTGLFGNAHRNNTFTEATSGSPNTTGHLDHLGNDIMAPSSSVDERLATGTDFQRFNPFDQGYLERKQVHDEGR